MAGPKAGEQRIGLISGLAEIYGLMSPRRRRQLFFVFLLMLVGAAAELATIGAVIPLLSLLADTGNRRWPLLGSLLPRGMSPVVGAALIFILIALLAGAVRVSLAWCSRNFILQLGHELAVEVQRRVLQQPLIFHIHRNSASLVAALAKTELLVMDVLLPLMNAVAGAIIGGLVIAGLLYVSPVATFASVAGFGIIYALISAATQRRLAANSKEVEVAYDRRLQTVQESLGGIRDVIIDDSSAMYLDAFSAIDARLANVRQTNQFISAAPRFLLEMVGMVAIALVALVLAERNGGIAAALPLLGAIAIGAQRLLPLAQEIYLGWSAYVGQRSVFEESIRLLGLSVDASAGPAADPLPLNESIRVDNVSFAYPTRKQPALDGISLSIPRGCMIAFQGSTGSGKSTLLDLLMGLLQPDHGTIRIDEAPLGPAIMKRWHRSIAHVPQSIYLADTSIAENIALSLPAREPDQARILQAARLAQLDEFIASLPEGYDTPVGERGVRLSGGQRQRLGIARAIYKDTPILVLDEATSALDDATETAVMDALQELKRIGRTIILVAHRQSSIRRCDMVVRVEHGQIVKLS